MRILLLTAGSRGDVQPLLALALNLQARGHQVCLAAPPNFAGWIGACGLRFEPFGSDMQALLEERAHLIGDKPIRLVAGVLDILQTEMAKQHKFLL
ncbi:MAG: glycosyltransferase, partial [Candidatus Sericytochromatia bacterium]